MNCERVRERMMEWMDARLDPATANEMKAHVDGCPACQAELAAQRRMLNLLDQPPSVQPSPALRRAVLQAIEAEKQAPTDTSPAPAASRRRPVWLAWGWLQAAAACALLAVGYLAGSRQAASTAASHREVAELREKIDSVGQLVGYTLQQQAHSSTDQRLEAVFTTAAAKRPDSRTIDGLITTLALDPSVNVRLSAVQALYAHADQEVVRTAIAVSLPRESSPLVQLAMIDFLAAAKDSDARPVLARLQNDPQADPNVREAARRALTQIPDKSL